MSLKKWVSVISLAVAVGSMLSLVWVGDWRYLWTALVMFVVSGLSFAMAVADEEHAKSD